MTQASSQRPVGTNEQPQRDTDDREHRSGRERRHPAKGLGRDRDQQSTDPAHHISTRVQDPCGGRRVLARHGDRRRPVGPLGELGTPEAQRQQRDGQIRIVGGCTEKKKTGNQAKTNDAGDSASPAGTDAFAEPITPQPANACRDCTDQPGGCGIETPFQDPELSNIDEVLKSAE